MHPQQVENIGIVNSVLSLKVAIVEQDGTLMELLPNHLLFCTSLSVDCEDVGFEETHSQGH